MNTHYHKQLTLRNRVEELTRVEAFLEELATEWDLPVKLILNLNLALEEAVTNIMFYGYDDEEVHTILIDFTRQDDLLTISIMDDGHAYDPTARPDPDITLAAEDRPIGGLGIFLIKKIMDQVEYERKENKNYLTLNKRIEQ
ncbi:MAG: ATP-binding protein [Bacteroidales bacterium]|nr:ATP-binding protein [Bacteroidales bacterium]